MTRRTRVPLPADINAAVRTNDCLSSRLDFIQTQVYAANMLAAVYVIQEYDRDRFRQVVARLGHAPLITVLSVLVDQVSAYIPCRHQHTHSFLSLPIPFIDLSVFET